MMADMIERVGIGGDFLKEKETARRLRAGEHFAPAISSRQAYDQWVADGRDEVARARERMDALFAARAERGRPLAERRARRARRGLRRHAGDGGGPRPLTGAGRRRQAAVADGGDETLLTPGRGALRFPPGWIPEERKDAWQTRNRLRPAGSRRSSSSSTSGRRSRRCRASSPS